MQCQRPIQFHRPLQNPSSDLQVANPHPQSVPLENIYMEHREENRSEPSAPSENISIENEARNIIINDYFIDVQRIPAIFDSPISEELRLAEKQNRRDFTKVCTHSVEFDNKITRVKIPPPDMENGNTYVGNFEILCKHLPPYQSIKSIKLIYGSDLISTLDAKIISNNTFKHYFPDKLPFISSFIPYSNFNSNSNLNSSLEFLFELENDIAVKCPESIIYNITYNIYTKSSNESEESEELESILTLKTDITIPYIRSNNNITEIFPLINNRCIALHLRFPDPNLDLIDISPYGLKMLFNNNEIKISKTQLQTISSIYGKNVIPLYNGDFSFELDKMINLSEIIDFKILIENPQTDINFNSTIIDYISVDVIHKWTIQHPNRNPIRGTYSGIGSGNGNGVGTGSRNGIGNGMVL